MKKGNLKALFRSALTPLPRHLRERLIMMAYLGYAPHIRSPRTFNEKIAHRKLYQFDPRFSEYADKFRVRDHVSRIVGPHYLNEVYAICSDVDDLDLALLPDRFVAKPTHGSKSLLIVDDKASLDEEHFRSYMNAALQHDFGAFQSEYWYATIPRRLIVESRMTDVRYGVPLDFKFYVFHGQVHLVHVDFDRQAGHKRTLFDRHWAPLNVQYAHPVGPLIEQPRHLAEMLDVAEALGAEFDFVRVDLYTPDDARIVFGEMTFAPEGGRRRFTPRSFDFELGELW